MDIEFEGPHQVRRQGIEYWDPVPVVVIINDVEFTAAAYAKDGA